MRSALCLALAAPGGAIQRAAQPSQPGMEPMWAPAQQPWQPQPPPQPMVGQPVYPPMVQPAWPQYYGQPGQQMALPMQQQAYLPMQPPMPVMQQPFPLQPQSLNGLPEAPPVYEPASGLLPLMPGDVPKKEEESLLPTQPPAPTEPPTVHFLPDNGVGCFEGYRHQVSSILASITKSPLSSMYFKAVPLEGKCPGSEEQKGIPDRCFPTLTLYVNSSHSRAMLAAAEVEAVQEHVGGGFMYEGWNEVRKLCHNGTRTNFGMAPVLHGNLPDEHWRPQPPVPSSAHTLIPDNNMYCLQGSQSYLAAILDRLQSSHVAHGFKKATVTPGSCQGQKFKNGPNKNRCWPRATIFTDDDTNHYAARLNFDRESYESNIGAFANMSLYEARKTMAKSTCLTTPESEQVLSLARETEEERMYIPPVAALIPDNRMSCMQGSMAYLTNALEKMRQTELGQLFMSTYAPVQGSCADNGFNEGGGSFMTHEVGYVSSKCFPQAKLFWDREPSHHAMLKHVELHLIEMGREGERERVRAMCETRAEQVFLAPMPVLLP